MFEHIPYMGRQAMVSGGADTGVDLGSIKERLSANMQRDADGDQFTRQIPAGKLSSDRKKRFQQGPREAMVSGGAKTGVDLGSIKQRLATAGTYTAPARRPQSTKCISYEND